MRKLLVKTLVGSRNYNLDDENSDFDWKVFTQPTFEDLYTGEMFSNQMITETEDTNTHDIRKLPSLLWKANLNFLEALHSKLVTVYTSDDELYEIFSYPMADRICRMNLKQLYYACIGMHHEKMKMLNKGTEGTHHLVDKFGYDTKQAQHAYRVLDFLERYYDLGFDDFDRAVRYNDFSSNPSEGKILHAIKAGEFPESNFNEFAERKLRRVKEKCEQSYVSKSSDEKLKKQLDEMITNVVKRNLDLGGF